MVVKLYFTVILIMLNPMHSASNESQLIEIDGVSWCKPLRFRVPPGPVVALASYPGSGNTWLRYLLQQSTGILTGSTCFDGGLYEGGFPGENATDGSVLVVKIHGAPEERFQSALLLIRDPRDTILSSFHYQLAGHTGTAEKTDFQSPEWSEHVNSELQAWEGFQNEWLNKFYRPLHIVFYEELVRDLIPRLGKILNFLHVKVTLGDLQCTLRNREGLYHRQKEKNFNPFTPRMMQKINEVRSRLLEKVRTYLELTTTIPVSDRLNVVSLLWSLHHHSRPHRHSQRTQPKTWGRRSFL